MLPIQCRMARAALNWTVRDLADKSGTGVNTVSRFESGQETMTASIARMREALEVEGIRFIPENGGGVGVRLDKPTEILVRGPSRVVTDHVPFAVAARNRRCTVFVHKDILDDLDQKNRRTEAGYLKSFERNRATLLRAAGTAIDKGHAGPDGNIHLRHEDFPEEVWRRSPED